MASVLGLRTTAPAGGETWVNSHGVKQALDYLHYAYPLTLLVLFLFTFMIHSIYQVPSQVPAPNTQKTGPGGKPLPRDKSPKKTEAPGRNDFSPSARLSFSWALVCVTLTFLADAVLICVHTLADRDNNWWCGQPVAVCALSATGP